MALINCPECNKEVSDQADKCPNCAYPINRIAQQVTQTKVTEVQFTRKKFKRSWIIATIILFVGLGLSFNRETQDFGFFLIFVAIIYRLIVRFRVYWHHK